MTAKLIYVAMQSLDGHVEDRQGKYERARPDDEVHQFVNDLLRPVATHLYGRRMDETIQGWEALYGAESDPPVERDFAKLWRAADKVVYSTMLGQVSTQSWSANDASKEAASSIFATLLVGPEARITDVPDPPTERIGERRCSVTAQWWPWCFVGANGVMSTTSPIALYPAWLGCR